MLFFSGVSARLREERERLGLNQTEFGDLGKASKRSQVYYESGEREPLLSYLDNLAEAGVDVGYILFGERERFKGRPSVVSEDATELLRHWRKADEMTKEMVMRVLKG